MSHYDFTRVALAVPQLYLADLDRNFEEHYKLIKEAVKSGVQVICFPELSLTGYTCGELFHQQLMHDKVLEFFLKFEGISQEFPDIVFIFGAPFKYDGSLYNCAIVYGNGKLLGVIPKLNLPSYNEFKETIYFTAGSKYTQSISIEGIDNSVPFGSEIVFEAINNSKLKVGIEICEDLWALSPPSSALSSNGASLIFNLSASNELVLKSQYRRDLVKVHSKRLKSAYCYVSPGLGESTMDIIFSGQSMIYESGELLCELDQFKEGSQLLIQDIDLGKLENSKLTRTDFKLDLNNVKPTGRRIYFKTLLINFEETPLKRAVSSKPYLPELTDSDFQTLIKIQSYSLAKRLERSSSEKMLIGLSGGIDSTYALFICLEALKILKLGKSNLIALSMPSFGTSDLTQSNLKELSKTLGVSLVEININELVGANLDLIDHSRLEDITFENTQARVRTQILFNYANKVNGIVVGTGDLSEIALGWMTYGGDHLSSFNVNSGIMKSQIIEVLKWMANRDSELKLVINKILETPISPELLSPKEGMITQKTEEVIGPFAVIDFYLHHILINKFPPKKILFLAERALEYSSSDLKIG